MTTHKNNPTGVTEEWFHLSLREVTYTFGVPTETIIEIVNEGIVSAEKDNNNELQFDSEAFRRIHKVLSLTKDLGVNLAGAGLALQLLEEIDRLQKLLQTK